MTPLPRRGAFAALLVAMTVTALVLLVPGALDPDADARAHGHVRARPSPASVTPAPAVDARIAVGRRAIGRSILPGFVGVSIEYSALSHYTGRDPSAINPIFVALLENLSPGQAPQIRIGGNSSDSTWWPVPGMARPRGINYTLTRRWLALARSLAQDTGARMTLGVDLEAGSPRLAAVEARALLHGVGARHVAALEIGNEPKRYALFPWYRNRAGRLVYIRPRNYGFSAFSRDFARAVAVMPSGVALAGPTFGGRTWISDLGRFMATEPRVRLITDHTYPLNRCWTAPGRPEYPTISRLLSTYASRGLSAWLPPYARRAHANGDGFRVDEMQSVACGGKAGVSDTFAAALWSLDALFSMARAGVDGVNFHTFPRAAYGLFRFWRMGGRWVGTVAPEYYGLVLFARAAPPGSHLLSVRHRGSAAIRAWATGTAQGPVRVLLLNDDRHRAHTVALSGLRPGVAASLVRLLAPAVSARTGVTLGGASVDPLSGRLGALHPSRVVISERGGLQVTVPAGSAALLTVAS